MFKNYFSFYACPGFREKLLVKDLLQYNRDLISKMVQDFVEHVSNSTLHLSQISVGFLTNVCAAFLLKSTSCRMVLTRQLLYMNVHYT